MIHLDSLSEALKKAAVNRSRLIVLANKQTEDIEYPQLNLNQELSELLIKFSKKERSKYVAQLVGQLVVGASSNVVLLFGLEILFDRSLAVDPLRLMKNCSKNQTLLIVWPGDITKLGLSYALPSHPEYRTYKASELSDLVFLATNAQLH